MSSPLITGPVASEHVAQLPREACIGRLAAGAVGHITNVVGRLRASVPPGRAEMPCCPQA